MLKRRTHSKEEEENKIDVRTLRMSCKRERREVIKIFICFSSLTISENISILCQVLSFFC